MEELLPFLKKYSEIDVDFIKRFTEICNGDKKHAPFTIDLDMVADWLKTEKGELKKTLIKSYARDIDYILLAPENTRSIRPKVTSGRSGHNKELILLTPDTFKMLTMKSKTAEAQKVRHYYVILEKLVEVYKDQIINNQDKKIRILERNLKRVKYPVKGALYIVKLTEKDKDGFRISETGDGDMNHRVKGYNTHHKDDPDVVYIYYTHDRHRLEKCVRNALKYYEYRNNKDFYVTDINNIIEALKDCDHLITKFKCNAKDSEKKMSREQKNKKSLFKIEFSDLDESMECDNNGQSGGKQVVENKYMVNKFNHMYMINKLNYHSLIKQLS
jgi:hypothetical protein